MNYSATNSISIGEKIKNLRKWLRISQQTVSDFLEIPRTAVSAIEKGTREINYTELSKLSKLFRCDPNSLFGMKITPVDPVPMNFKARLNKDTELSNHDKNEIANFTQFLECQVPKAEKSLTSAELKQLKNMTPQRAADFFLEKFSSEIPVDIYSIVIDLGIYPRFTALLDLAGAIVRTKNQSTGQEVFGILINSDQPEERMRFSAAHETAHYLLDHVDDGFHVSPIARWKDAVELDADSFAAECLMPRAALEQEAKKYLKTGISPTDAIQIADKFLVSYRAILHRLLELGFISQVQYESHLQHKVKDIRDSNSTKKSKAKKFDSSSIEPIFNYLTKHTTNNAFINSPDCVRWLQESAYLDYSKSTKFDERATDVKDVYESVALWLAKNK